MDNIILIGMPGCGKSTVGVLLAKNLGLDFLDCDLLIQQTEGKLLHEIITQQGGEGFLEIENRILSGITATRTVISTGGSAVYGKEAMAHLRRLGHVIYLKIDYPTLERRLGDYSHRGVVVREGGTLYDMYCERTALYEQYADAVIDESKTEGNLSKTVEQCLRICERLLKS